MATNVSSEVCSICTEKFRDPKLLPCFHTFCLECLQQFVFLSSKDGQFPCPLCRYQVTLPEKGVAGFQTNFYIAARAEKQVHGGGECCGVCEQQATHSCRECEILLCESCTKCHQTLPSTRSHMLINIGESGTGIPFLSMQKFCEKHNEEKLRFFCMPCGKVICRDCKLTNHEGHKTKDISDVVKQARTSLTKTKEKLEKYKKETDETYQQIHHTSNEISMNIERTQKELNKLSKSLMKSPENVINKLTDIEEVHKKTFLKESCPLIERQSFLQGQIDYAGAILKEGLGSDVITTDDEMKRRLTEIEKGHLVALHCDHELSNIPHIRSVDAARMEAVNCCVNDIITDVIPPFDEIYILNLIRKFEFNRKRIHSLSFSETQNVWITLGNESLELCQFEMDKTTKRKLYSIPVTMEQLQKYGIGGSIHMYDNEHPFSILKNEFHMLKKGYLYKDTNTNGDTCKVDKEYHVVIIKPVNGTARLVTFNPFAETGHEFTPVDVCWANDLEIFILDSGSKQIIVYSLKDGFQKSYTSRLLYSNPSAIAVDANGQIWVGNDHGIIYIYSKQ